MSREMMGAYLRLYLKNITYKDNKNSKKNFLLNRRNFFFFSRGFCFLYCFDIEQKNLLQNHFGYRHSIFYATLLFFLISLIFFRKTFYNTNIMAGNYNIKIQLHKTTKIIEQLKKKNIL